jgi:hypothetical protein
MGGTIWQSKREISEKTEKKARIKVIRKRSEITWTL